MNAPASEKEQLEALGKWWKENGSSIVIGLLLGLSALLGVKAWNSYQETQTLNASHVYTRMLAAQNRQEHDQVRTSANELIGNYSGTSYAALAALILARNAVEDGELDAADAQLRWALENSDLPEIRHNARLRLVRVLIAKQAYSEADQMLGEVTDPGAFGYLYDELRGDLALAQGNREAAVAHYRKALDGMPAQSPNAGLLTTKYENLPGSAADAAP